MLKLEDINDEDVEKLRKALVEGVIDFDGLRNTNTYCVVPKEK